jgi:hypothetical protein
LTFTVVGEAPGEADAEACAAGAGGIEAEADGGVAGEGGCPPGAAVCAPGAVARVAGETGCAGGGGTVTAARADGAVEEAASSARGCAQFHARSATPPTATAKTTPATAATT